MRKKRAYYSADEKVNIIRKHLLEKVPISDFCEQHKLQPTVFYRWQKQFFEHGAWTFDAVEKIKDSSQEEKILAPEQKLQTKNEVLSELMEEHLKTVPSDMLRPGINSKDEKKRFSIKVTRNWKRPERVD